MSLFIERTFNPSQSLNDNAADWAFTLYKELEMEHLDPIATKEFLYSQCEQYRRDFFLAIEEYRAFC